MEKMSVLIAPADSTLTFNSNHLIESLDHELYAVSVQPSRLLTSWPEPRDSRIVIIIFFLFALQAQLSYRDNAWFSLERDASENVRSNLQDISQVI